MKLQFPPRPGGGKKPKKAAAKKASSSRSTALRKQDWELALIGGPPVSDWRAERKKAHRAMRQSRLDWRAQGGQSLLQLRRQMHEVATLHGEKHLGAFGIAPFPLDPVIASTWIAESRRFYTTNDRGERIGRITDRYLIEWELTPHIPTEDPDLKRPTTRDGYAWWDDNRTAAGVYWSRAIWYEQFLARIDVIEGKLTDEAHRLGVARLLKGSGLPL